MEAWADYGVLGLVILSLISALGGLWIAYQKSQNNLFENQKEFITTMMSMETVIDKNNEIIKRQEEALQRIESLVRTLPEASKSLSTIEKELLEIKHQGK